MTDRRTVQASCPDLDVRINNPFKDLGALSPPQLNAGTFSNQILLGPHVSKLRRPKQVSKAAPHSGFQQTHCIYSSNFTASLNPCAQMGKGPFVTLCEVEHKYG